MSAYKIGDRVGAIQSANQEEVQFYGYGIYAGDEVPDKGVGGIGDLIRELGRTNPKIILDDGGTVWGCECWWGPEEKIRASIAGRRLVKVEGHR